MKEFKTDLIHFGYVNKNGRIYSDKDIDMTDLNSHVLYGEMGYPTRLETSLTEVSHRITDLEMYGDALYGKVEVLETPKGKILKN